ncbi:hypothetical protein L0Z64_04685 [Phaeobacter sp. BS23]
MARAHHAWLRLQSEFDRSTATAPVNHHINPSLHNSQEQYMNIRDRAIPNATRDTGGLSGAAPQQIWH